ncbi:MAG: hypothetical protein IPL39_07070 [Opitutaceae bacterium]|nr:hypothetical protein [Opitutaceae bacterium]
MNTRGQPFTLRGTPSVRLLVAAAALFAANTVGAATAIPLETLENPAPSAGDVTIREVLPGRIPVSPPNGFQSPARPTL